MGKKKLLPFSPTKPSKHILYILNRKKKKKGILFVEQYMYLTIEV